MPARVDAAYLTDFLFRAIAYPTPASDEGEPDDQVLGFLEEVVATELEQLGLDLVDFDEMGNVCGRLNGLERNQPAILLVGYSMTRSPGSMADPYSPRTVDGSEMGTEGELVVGRGARVQKGSLASLMAALQALSPSGVRPSSDVHLVCLASGETGRHDAIRGAIDHFRLEPGGAVVGVSTGNDIVIGHKGRVDVEVRVHGRSAHSSSPDLGVNAIVGANEVISRLGSVDLGDGDPDLGGRTMTPVALHASPHAAHTIPELATISLDLGMFPGDSPEVLVSQLSAVVSKIDGYRVETESKAVMYPSNVSTEEWIVTALASAVRRASGSSPALLKVPAATDAGYLNSHGIPAVLFGPGHLTEADTDADYVSLDEAVEAGQAIVHLLTD